MLPCAILVILGLRRLRHGNGEFRINSDYIMRLLSGRKGKGKDKRGREEGRRDGMEGERRGREQKRKKKEEEENLATFDSLLDSA